MKRIALIVATLLPLVSGSTPMAQSSGDAGILISADKPDDAPKRGNVFLVWRQEFYLDNPVSSVPAKAIAAGGAAPTAAKFSVRGWREGDHFRAVVYAVLADRQSPTGEVETPISTRTLKVGQSAEITETDAWKAAHVFIRAVPASALH